MMKYGPIFLLIIAIWSCQKEETSNENPSTSPPNILLIIADDMGKDATAGFSEGSIKPNTPNLDRIKNEGLSFTNAWVNPTCSPTRASILTGKYGYRTGVKWANDGLSNTETTLHQYIDEQTNSTYANALIGKWHLSGETPTENPENYGIDYYAGLTRGAVQDYYQWQLFENGSGSLETEYTTKVFTDLSINWINNQTQPWFLWLAYNAPHTPFHVPPSEMHQQGDLPPYEDGMDALPYYLAAIEAMDYQIGVLLESIPDEELANTTIIFIADNGTPVQVAQAPFSNNSAKGSLYQGGINVPLYVSGAEVQRTGEDQSLICNTDLFCTIANLAGVPTTNLHDSQSFATLLKNSGSHRDFQYTEMQNDNNDRWTISDGSFKLIVDANGTEEMYHLENDPYEDENLLDGTLTAEAAYAKEALEEELSNIRN